MGHSPRLDTRGIQEPIPVATSSPGKPPVTSSGSRLHRDTDDGDSQVFREELDISLDSPVVEETLMKETHAPRRPDSSLDEKINKVFSFPDSSSQAPVKDGALKDGDTVKTSAPSAAKTSGTSSPHQMDLQSNVPKVVLDNEKDLDKDSQLSADDAAPVKEVSPIHSPGTLRKCASESNMAAGELEVPTSNLDVSASSSIEDWTQTEDLEGVWSCSVGFTDSGTDPDNSDLLDELERLRRERQRILDMLAKDMMPSKLQVRNFHSCRTFASMVEICQTVQWRLQDFPYQILMWLCFIKFVYQNERIGTLSGGLDPLNLPTLF